MYNLLLCVALSLMFTAAGVAQPTVPAGYVVDTLLDQIDGNIPKLEAVRNPAYGAGVITAKVNNGILTVQRVSDDQLVNLATVPGFAANSGANTVRFGRDPMEPPTLFVGVHDYVATGDCITPVESNLLYAVSVAGEVDLLVQLGQGNNGLALSYEFLTGNGGFSDFALVLDGNACPTTPGCSPGGSQSSLFSMNALYALSLVACNAVPPGRTDIDINGFEQDQGGAYGFDIVAADHDINQDNVSVIYRLNSGFGWTELTTPVLTSSRFYGDLAVSPGGAFGNLCYVVERVSDTLQTVDPAGTHTVFASGFENLISVTVTDDGNVMYVSDATGIYRIRPSGTSIGPTLIAQQPCVEPDDVHTGATGVDDVRFIFNDAVMFNSGDVSVTNGLGDPVGFSVSGSNSQFMLIAFAAPVLNDVYTITVADSVFSAETGAPIDGDEDGMAGGDLVVNIEHRSRQDVDNNGVIDVTDLISLILFWTPAP